MMNYIIAEADYFLMRLPRVILQRGQHLRTTLRDILYLLLLQPRSFFTGRSLSAFFNVGKPPQGNPF